MDDDVSDAEQISALKAELAQKDAVIAELRNTIMMLAGATKAPATEGDGGRSQVIEWIRRHRLTNRQVTAALFAVQGESGHEFARALDLKPSGGRVHWIALMAKTQTDGKRELVAKLKEELRGVTPEAWEAVTGIPWDWPSSWRSMDEVTDRLKKDN